MENQNKGFKQWLIGLLILALGGGGALALGGLGDTQCIPSSITAIEIGNEEETQLLSTSSDRAWVKFQMLQFLGDGNGTATGTAYLAFNNGAAAATNTGLALRASSTAENSIVFGLETEFKYTGAVRGITDIGSTSLLVTECNYN